jgi:hypothetical protein
VTVRFVFDSPSRQEALVTNATRGRLTDLVVVRMHGRAAAYLAASETARAGIVAECRREATVPDLAERIVSRTIYAQSASRLGPLRELLQNALDASPRGARVDVRSSADGAELSVTDRGRGMTRTELLGDLLVPFRSGKEQEPEAIGEHGIGFFSALELAPRIQVLTTTRGEGWVLTLEPAGHGPPYGDFAWSLAPLADARSGPTGTSVLLRLAQPVPRAVLAAEITQVAGLVDASACRIYVDDALVNTARGRMRRVASAPVETPRGSLGELDLYLGQEGTFGQEIAITQAGLLVAARAEPFAGAELALHRDLSHALALAGYGLVVDLPLAVPLNKGRSAVAAHAAAAVDRAMAVAFERFVLGDALWDRDLLRAVDHRLASILDRLVASALAGEPAPSSVGAARPGAAPDARPVVGVPAASERQSADGDPTSADELAPTQPKRAGASSRRGDAAPSARAPTVAAPEEVIRFASALLDAPLFTLVAHDGGRGEIPRRAALREVLDAYRAGRLRAVGDPVAPGLFYLVVTDPLPRALWHRISRTADVGAAVHVPAGTEPRVRAGSLAMTRVGRDELAATAGGLPGVPVLVAMLEVLERIDAAISAAAEIGPSPISVHQDLYGPDEMAHTDGSGISVNFASPRVRALFAAALSTGDPIAFGALVDLLLHEKTHVSLATFVPRATAEHGQSFYRRKDLLRRSLLQRLAAGAIDDPRVALDEVRAGLTRVDLPAPEHLAKAFSSRAAA